MAVSGAAAVAGLNLGGVETMIALSGVVLGLCVLTAARPPLWMAMTIVAVFAVFHGYAHGAELPESAKTWYFPRPPFLNVARTVEVPY